MNIALTQQNCGKNIVTLLPAAGVPLIFVLIPHFDVLCDLLLIRDSTRHLLGNKIFKNLCPENRAKFRGKYNLMQQSNINFSSLKIGQSIKSKKLGADVAKIRKPLPAPLHFFLFVGISFTSEPDPE